MTQKKKVGKYCKVVLESYKDELIIQNNLKCLRSRKQNRLKFSQMPMDTQRTRDQGLVYRTRADPGKTGEQKLWIAGRENTIYIRWIYWLHLNWMDHKTSLASKSKCSRRPICKPLSSPQAAGIQPRLYENWEPMPHYRIWAAKYRCSHYFLPQAKDCCSVWIKMTLKLALLYISKQMDMVKQNKRWRTILL